MKIKVLFTALLLASVFSCTKSNETPTPSTEQTLNEDNYKCNFNLSVRLYTVAGFAPSGIPVNIAASADSLANGLYLATEYTNNNMGEAKFNDVDLGNNSTRKIYYNTSFQFRDENFKGEGESIIQSPMYNAYIIVTPSKDN